MLPILRPFACAGRNFSKPKLPRGFSPNGARGEEEKKRARSTSSRSMVLCKYSPRTTVMNETVSATRSALLWTGDSPRRQDNVGVHEF
ncbi:sodium/hydrogen exchanger 2-like protein [Anopheles sinensis]|uniref:Sodium/hydrogen exchanger 2-like protein n=1 Tax=Anopheles sinensis TaxID=74873 RepID=A0A084VTK6_ANOSI|nr:sodium/hydrogen exchanger 2-like protein [Anopheles sinensis]